VLGDQFGWQNKVEISQAKRAHGIQVSEAMCVSKAELKKKTTRQEIAHARLSA
jgi:hypothetical protein